LDPEEPLNVTSLRIARVVPPEARIAVALVNVKVPAGSIVPALRVEPPDPSTVIFPDTETVELASVILKVESVILTDPVIVVVAADAADRVDPVMVSVPGTVMVPAVERVSVLELSVTSPPLVEEVFSAVRVELVRVRVLVEVNIGEEPPVFIVKVDPVIEGIPVVVINPVMVGLESVMVKASTVKLIVPRGESASATVPAPLRMTSKFVWVEDFL